jgi:transposase
MERLEPKNIHGHVYYYYSSWAWVDGKCRRTWQKYLGKLEDIVKAVEGDDTPPLYAEVFSWGLPMALWKECQRANVTQEINALCPKRNQGLTTGDYLTIAALNRAIAPRSKRSLWDWFSNTALLRALPHVSRQSLSSQRFWDHMERIDEETAVAIWKKILSGVVTREAIDLSSISYDGTNYYTFIDTFTTRCTIAQRGKNKQGRCNLRQVNYALFCSADGHLPLYYDVYEGNRNDAKEFPLILDKFQGFLVDLFGGTSSRENITLIFDKGNNSAKNFELIDSLKLHFVGSVKLDEHKDLAHISNKDSRFVPCVSASLASTKSFRVTQMVYGRKRTVVVTFNEKLFQTQWLTVNNDLNKAIGMLDGLRRKLQDRIEGNVTLGKCPTLASVEKQVKDILHRQYLSRIITVTVAAAPDGIPRLEYTLDASSFQDIADTYLGKTLLITSREQWDDQKIITSYRSQFIIEEVFRETKDRLIGNWWPLHHWTDSKIKVHALYCTIALLLRALAYRKMRRAGLTLSMKRFLAELGRIREVINIYPHKGKRKKERQQSVLTKCSDIQTHLCRIFDLKHQE